MSAITNPLPTPPDNFSTQIASATVSSSAITFNVDDASGLPTEGVGVLFKKDSSGDIVAGSIEFVHWTGVSGNTVNLSDTGDRGLTGSDSGAQSYVADDYFEVWVSSFYYGSLKDALPTGTVVGTTDTQTLTNKTLTSPTFQSVTGWVDANETWTYSAWDDTNGVSTATITVPTDATTKYQPGMRVKFTQSTGGTKYGIITKVEATALTVFVNTDYQLENEAITAPYYSPMDTPFGFVKDPLKYEVETSFSGASQASPVQNTWYNINTNTIDVPVGSWNVYYQTPVYVDDSSATAVSVEVTLSTANNTESDEKWSTQVGVNGASGTIVAVGEAFKQDVLTLSTKDTYYLNARTTATGITSINIGYQTTGQIRAICAYL